MTRDTKGYFNCFDEGVTVLSISLATAFLLVMILFLVANPAKAQQVTEDLNKELSVLTTYLSSEEAEECTREIKAGGRMDGSVTAFWVSETNCSGELSGRKDAIYFLKTEPGAEPKVFHEREVGKDGVFRVDHIRVLSDRIVFFGLSWETKDASGNPTNKVTIIYTIGEMTGGKSLGIDA